MVLITAAEAMEANNENSRGDWLPLHLPPTPIEFLDVPALLALLDSCHPQGNYNGSGKTSPTADPHYIPHFAHTVCTCSMGVSQTLFLVYLAPSISPLIFIANYTRCLRSSFFRQMDKRAPLTKMLAYMISRFLLNDVINTSAISAAAHKILQSGQTMLTTMTYMYLHWLARKSLPPLCMHFPDRLQMVAYFGDLHLGVVRPVHRDRKWRGTPLKFKRIVVVKDLPDRFNEK